MPSAERLLKLVEENRAGSADRGSRVAFYQEHLHPDSRPWTLEGHEYLAAPAQDAARHVVVEKAAQVGFSTLAIGEMLDNCRRGLNIGYFLDTKQAMAEFVQARVDPIISADDGLIRMVTEEEFLPDRPKRRGKGMDNVRQKRIGKAVAYFLGVNNWGDVKTRAMDGIYLDEVSKYDPELVAFVDDRMLHSPHKIRREFSQPKFPGLDIDEAFQRSDQKYWQLRCPRCRRWWALEDNFPACLYQVRDEWRIGCPKCHIRLDASKGEWVAVHPGRPISGYHLSQLYGPYIEPAMVAEKWELAQTSSYLMAALQISILGKPYAGDAQPLTAATFRTRCGGWGLSRDGSGLPPGAAYAGIDVGAKLHLTIYRRCADGTARVVWMEAIKTDDVGWATMATRLEAHGVQFFVIDVAPETSAAKSLCRRMQYPDGRPRGAVIYTNSRTTTYETLDKDSAPVEAIHTNRTEMVDDFAGAVKGARLWYPDFNLSIVQEAQRHCEKLVKDVTPDGTMRYRSKVENHWGFSGAHALFAERAAGAVQPAEAGHFSGGGNHPNRPDRHAFGNNIAPRDW